jgi:hypothetical protein
MRSIGGAPAPGTPGEAISAARTDVEQYVVRAGLARPAPLIVGTTPHPLVPGLAGFSVQSAPGLPVEKLARAGRYPHPWISVTTVVILRRHGFDLVFPTPGKGAYHATVRAPCPLPADIAVLLSDLFIRRRNPHPGK